MSARKNIVLIHGFLESSKMWGPITHNIGGGFRIHTPELPGHGDCPFLGESTMEEMATVVAKEIPDQSVVVGHSMGGYVAIHVAKLFPEKVNALCLFHSRAGDDDEERKANRDRAIEAVKQNKGLYAQLLISALFSPRHKELYYRVINQQVAHARKMKTEAIIASIEAMKNRKDQIDFLKTRAFPLYYFLGGEDPVMPFEMVKKEMDQLPGSVYYLDPEAGHMGQFECTHAAREFVQRIGRAEYDPAKS